MNRIRTDVFKGLHKRDGAPEGAFLEVSGVTTADYPTMKVRTPRSRYGEWENATDVYETDGHMVVIDDNKLYYDGTELRPMTPGRKQFAEINRKLVSWPDKVYINLNTGEVGGLEASVSGNVSKQEKYKMSKEAVQFPLYFKKSYTRATEHDTLESIPVNLGLKVRGIEYR